MLKGLAQKQQDFGPSMPIAIEPGHWREFFQIAGIPLQSTIFVFARSSWPWL
jgi:hypothetical protein